MRTRSDTTARWTAALALAAALVGCAEQAQSPGDPFVTGTVSAEPKLSGASLPGPQDGCAWRAGALDNYIKKLASLKARTANAPSGPPQTIEEAFKRSWNDAASIATDDYARARLKADQINASLRASGCTPLDIDAKLANAQAALPEVPLTP